MLQVFFSLSHTSHCILKFSLFLLQCRLTTSFDTDETIIHVPVSSTGDLIVPDAVVTWKPM
jgi:hypothetical protein